MQLDRLEIQPRPRLFHFFIAWIVAWCLAGELPFILLQTADPSFRELGILLYFTALGTLQFFVIRRFLQVKLPAWIPLTVAGAIAGIVSFNAYMSGSLFIGVPQFAMMLPYLLLWSTPPIFQWFALRRRFRYHALWLLAAVVIAPLSNFLSNGPNPGVFKLALAPLHNLTGTTSPFLQSLASSADAGIPAAVLCLALYAIVTQDRLAQFTDKSAV